MSPLRWISLSALCVSGLLTACADLPSGQSPTVDRPPPAAPINPVASVKKLPHPAGEPVAVAIYDFRSSVSDVAARGATDMFINALVQNGKFKVVERSQLNQGLLPEKQLGLQGVTGGKNAAKKLRDVDYLFEGTISEANASETQRSGQVSVAGMAVGGGKNRDVIAIDVRIVEASTGDVLDSLTVRQTIKSDSANVSGIGNLLSTVMAQKGVSSPYTPDANVGQQRKQSLDGALRSVINEAVAQLATRF